VSDCVRVCEGLAGVMMECGQCCGATAIRFEFLRFRVGFCCRGLGFAFGSHWRRFLLNAGFLRV